MKPKRNPNYQLKTNCRKAFVECGKPTGKQIAERKYVLDSHHKCVVNHFERMKTRTRREEKKMKKKIT